jgi:hypothetical protein
MRMNISDGYAGAGGVWRAYVDKRVLKSFECSVCFFSSLALWYTIAYDYCL